MESDWTGAVGTSDGLKCNASCELLPCCKVLCGDAGEAVVRRVGVEDGLGMTFCEVATCQSLVHSIPYIGKFTRC